MIQRQEHDYYYSNEAKQYLLWAAYQLINKEFSNI